MFASRASAVAIGPGPPAPVDVRLAHSAQERLLTEAFRDMYSILAELRSSNLSELQGAFVHCVLGASALLQSFRGVLNESTVTVCRRFFSRNRLKLAAGWADEALLAHCARHTQAASVKLMVLGFLGLQFRALGSACQRLIQGCGCFRV